MRKLILSMQVSLDGIVSDPSGKNEWVQRDDHEQWRDIFEMLENVDLFLLGRVMFPEYRNYWKQALTDPAVPADHRAYAQLADKTSHIVFSNTLTDSEWANTRINHGPVAEEIAKLKLQPGHKIQVVGGAKLAATVIEAGLVDEYRLVINPVIIGEGKSFFKLQHSWHQLELTNVKPLKSGVLIARYIAKH